MKPICLTFGGTLPPHFAEALGQLEPLLGITQGKDGPLVEGFSANGPELHIHGTTIRLGWKKPVHFWRALSLLPSRLGQGDVEYAEQPCFETGFMVDASRNAVPSLDALETLLRSMALMGMDTGMLYTEETYELPGYPYFGYMRGRYTHEELARLDSYADLFGIELIPFVQTLGHLDRALHWPSMQKYKDCGEVLLCDDPATLKLIRTMLRTASAPYRSNRIHIGMDEAHQIGLGRHLIQHGYENPHAIIRRHLQRVRDIAMEMGLEPIMWGDMFFRPDSPTGSYYDTGDPTEEAIASVAPGVQIMYWDYYHERKEDYVAMIRKHKKLGSTPLFAGGLWTWAGPAPDYQKAVACSVSGLMAAKEEGVPLCIACAWGDNGAEANMITALAGVQLYAEFEYTGKYQERWLEDRFRTCCGGEWSQFYGLTRFNCVEGMKSSQRQPVNAAKFLLYQDPMVQLYALDVAGLHLSAHYEALAAEYAEYAAEGGPYVILMEFYSQLGRTLAAKCRWHEESLPLIRSGNREGARKLSDLLIQASEDVDLLRQVWRDLWDTSYKPYGFEILDGRLGAIHARLLTASERIDAWIHGDPRETLPELMEEILPYIKQEDGSLLGSYAVSEIVSAGKLDD